MYFPFNWFTDDDTTFQIQRNTSVLPTPVELRVKPTSPFSTRTSDRHFRIRRVPFPLPHPPLHSTPANPSSLHTVTPHQREVFG